MEFKNLYERIYKEPEKFKTGCGNRFHPTYALGFDDKGRKILKEKKGGRIDVYAEIQSHAASVDINNIIQRFNNGDISVLDNGKGYFVDLTQFPKTYAEMIQRMQNAENYFDSLPLEERKRFNFSFEQFLAQEPTIIQQPIEEINEIDINEPQPADT